MRWKLETALYAQGWIHSQLHAMNEAAIAADSDVVEFHGALNTMEKIMQQWRVLDETMDDLVAENKELKRQLSLIRKTITPDAS